MVQDSYSGWLRHKQRRPVLHLNHSPFLADWFSLVNKIADDKKILRRTLVGKMFALVVALAIENNGMFLASGGRKHHGDLAFLPCRG